MAPTEPNQSFVAARFVCAGMLVALPVGALAGGGTAAFLRALSTVERIRGSHHLLVAGLPLAGLGVGLVVLYVAGRAAGGTRLVLDELGAAEAPEHPWRGVPLGMAPLVFGGSLITHLFGGSAGREGAAVQIAAGLGDATVGRLLGSRVELRRLGLIAAIAGGFGAVFGVPFAGAVFALEMPPRRSVRRMLAAPVALVASFTGDRVARALGTHHGAVPRIVPGAIGIATVGRYLVVAVAFGLAARLYVCGVELVKRTATRVVWLPARLVAGGAVVSVALFALGDRRYEGLSLPLISSALLGIRVAAFAWLIKLALTAVTVGCGFFGGEVTPLFAVGACLGSVVASPIGASRSVFAALGYVAVFGAASNTPIAFTVVAIERFGVRLALPAALCCAVARLVSGPSSVYGAARQPAASSRGT